MKWHLLGTDDSDRVFLEWWKSEPHRLKYDNTHPAFLAAYEAWCACAAAAAASPPKRKPLTAQQLDRLIEGHVGGAELADGEYSAMVLFAAAVERAVLGTAHGSEV